MIETLVLDDPAAELAERLVAAAGAGGHIALTGGSTPRAAYELAAGLAGDWSEATLWFGDERCVPPDHEESNYGMTKRALLDRLPAPGPTVGRIQGELGPGGGADAYERGLRQHFRDSPPRLDLVLLGLGPDAHVASLFPRAQQLGERERWAVGVEKPGMEPLLPRVTLTLPVLNAARQVVFLVTGQDKADAVRRAFAGSPGPDAPASLIAPAGDCTVLLDGAAAALLPRDRTGSPGARA